MKDNLKWTKSKVALIAFNCILCVAIIVSSMVIVIDKSRTKNGVVYNGNDTETTQKENENKVDSNKGNTSSSNSVNLMFAGDNLVHRSIFSQASVRTDGDSYDFSYAYENIKPILSKADVAFVNQESIIDTDSDVSSIPNINTPKEILNGLSDAGFDVINQATNHCFDYGMDGFNNNLNTLKNSDLKMVGLYESKDAMLTPVVKEANGIKISYIGITEKINEEEEFFDSDANVICLTDERYSQDVIYSKIKNMIDKAKGASDIVCVYVHWSDQDITSPSDTQREVVSRILDYGADIIVGSGTHTLQPIEFMKNSDNEQALVMWSLGNLIGCQSKNDAMLGGIASVTVTKSNGKANISSYKFIPTITHYEESVGNVRIIPLSDYTEELAEEHGIHEETDSFTFDYINEFYKNMFKDNLQIKY